MDLTAASASAGTAYERACRALDRFQDVPPGDATQDSIADLLDRFFAAAEAAWHCKDWLKRHCSDDGDTKALNDLTQSTTLQALKMIANASKHSGLDDPSILGTIRLNLATHKRRGPVMSLAELYRHLRVSCPEVKEIHPSDFLEDALHEWARFSREQFGTERWF